MSFVEVILMSVRNKKWFTFSGITGIKSCRLCLKDYVNITGSSLIPGVHETVYLYLSDIHPAMLVGLAAICLMSPRGALSSLLRDRGDWAGDPTRAAPLYPEAFSAIWMCPALRNFFAAAVTVAESSFLFFSATNSARHRISVINYRGSDNGNCRAVGQLFEMELREVYYVRNACTEAKAFRLMTVRTG